MNARARLALAGFAVLLVASACGSGGGGQGGQAQTTGTGGGGGCPHQGCDGWSLPEPAPQACNTAADCKTPEGVCWKACVCNDAPWGDFITYDTPSCVAGQCAWHAQPGPAVGCPGSIPAAGSPCVPPCNDGLGCSWSGDGSCGVRDVQGECIDGVWKLWSQCDCGGADETACEENPNCEWRSPLCFEVASAYCAPKGCSTSNDVCPSGFTCGTVNWNTTNCDPSCGVCPKAPHGGCVPSGG